MPTISVSRVLSNPRFIKEFTVFRKTGDWQAGRFVESENSLDFKGVVIPGGTKDIIQVPEGDRTSSIMVFLSKNEMFVTHDDISGKGTSDEIIWRNERYRIYQVKPWTDFGYFRAIGVSMGGV